MTSFDHRRDEMKKSLWTFAYLLLWKIEYHIEARLYFQDLLKIGWCHEETTFFLFLFTVSKIDEEEAQYSSLPELRLMYNFDPMLSLDTFFCSNE